MTDAKRRLTDIKFEHEGAHVALVGKHQGGPANGITTLVFKATDHIDPATIALAVAGQSVEQPTTIIEEPTVEQIEKSAHEALVLKAVEDAVALEKAAGAVLVAEVQKALDEQAEVLKSVQAEVETFKAAEVAAKVELRKAALTDAKVPAEKLEAVLKSLSALDDESFGVQVDLLKAMASAVDNSDMMQEQGVAGAGAESKEEEDRTTAILKARYGVK
uniref:Uncharacterized protein n=2 Tax=unclassified bacterial viruses TaxID=12333 RepID=A0AAU6VXM5_9VIRU